MLQLGGVWCDVIGVCYLLGPCRSSSHPPTVSSRKCFIHFSFKWTRALLFHTFSLWFSSEIFLQVFINVLVEVFTLRIVVSDGSSVLCSLDEPSWHGQCWLWWWPYNQMIIQGAVQYSVHCTLSYSRKPGVVLKDLSWAVPCLNVQIQGMHV